jgi:hypothetical protein
MTFVSELACPGFFADFAGNSCIPMDKNRNVGLTKDAGYQIGVRRTVAVRHEEAWAYIFSREGMGIWLGDLPGGHLEEGESYSLPDGTRIAVSVFENLSHVRMKWQPPEWENASRLQLRVYPASGEKTVIAFHQEMLQDAARREEMKQHWKNVVSRLTAQLTG